MVNQMRVGTQKQNILGVKSNEDLRVLLIFGLTMRRLVEIEDRMSGCEVTVKV